MSNKKSYRYDITNGLIHLTGDRTHQCGLSPEDALVQILRSRKLKGSSPSSGFIRGNQSATCLTEMPLNSVRLFLAEHNGGKKYSKFGIAMSKSTGWDLGARPVIYLPDTEGYWIPDSEKWRHVTYDLRSTDWTNEREWRAKGDMIISTKSVYALVPDSVAEERIKNRLVPSELSWVLGFIHLDYVFDIL